MRRLCMFVLVRVVVYSGVVQCKLDTSPLVRRSTQVVFRRIAIVSLLLARVFGYVVLCDRTGHIDLDVLRVLWVAFVFVSEFAKVFVWMLKRKQVLLFCVVVDCGFLWMVVVML